MKDIFERVVERSWSNAKDVWSAEIADDTLGLQAIGKLSCILVEEKRKLSSSLVDILWRDDVEAIAEANGEKPYEVGREENGYLAEFGHGRF